MLESGYRYCLDPEEPGLRASTGTIALQKQQVKE